MLTHERCRAFHGVIIESPANAFGHDFADFRPGTLAFRHRPDCNVAIRDCADHAVVFADGQHPEAAVPHRPGRFLEGHFRADDFDVPTHQIFELMMHFQSPVKRAEHNPFQRLRTEMSVRSRTDLVTSENDVPSDHRPRPSLTVNPGGNNASARGVALSPMSDLVAMLEFRHP
jgi:hypothetical protein